jgi:hypothetical protein
MDTKNIIITILSLVVICLLIKIYNDSFYTVVKRENMTVAENINKLAGRYECKRKLINTCESPNNDFTIPLIDDVCEYFVANLSGPEETPQNGSTGTGNVFLKLNDNLLILNGTAGIVNPLSNTITSGHIHIGDPGVAGPPVFTLVLDINGKSCNINSDRNYFTLTCEQVRLLKMGKYYINIHTTSFPDGEVRGQIVKSQ